MRAWKTVASVQIAALSVITIAVAASASPWTGLGNTAETVIYLGSAGPTALDPPGRLVRVAGGREQERHRPIRVRTLAQWLRLYVAGHKP